MLEEISEGVQEEEQLQGQEGIAWAVHWLDADGVLGRLAAAVPDQVGAVPPVEQLCFCLESLHWSCEPVS